MPPAPKIGIAQTEVPTFEQGVTLQKDPLKPGYSAIVSQYEDEKSVTIIKKYALFDIGDFFDKLLRFASSRDGSSLIAVLITASAFMVLVLTLGVAFIITTVNGQLHPSPLEPLRELSCKNHDGYRSTYNDKVYADENLTVPMILCGDGYVFNPRDNTNK